MLIKGYIYFIAEMKQIHGNSRDAASYEVANLLLRVDTGYIRYHFRTFILPSLYAYIIQFDYTKLLTKS